MKPGRMVASPRSITLAPAGMGPLPTDTILSPVTTIVAPSRRVVPVESNTCAALRTIVVAGAESAARAGTANALAQRPTATAVSLEIARNLRIVVFIRVLARKPVTSVGLLYLRSEAIRGRAV